MITVNAAAKINLSLDIVKRLDNGYHSLFMIMQSVDLYDTIKVEKCDCKGICITCNVADIPTDDSNIAAKAAKAFFNAANIENSGIKIDITKRIPHAAGLAGGSADGAGVIVALNEMFGTDFTQKELCDIGVKVGADVPFCIVGGTMLSQDIGGVLSPLQPLHDVFIVLAKPKAGVSTKGAYDAFDSAHNIKHPDNCNLLHAAVNGDFDKLFVLASNVFEQVIEVPERVNIKSVMRKHNCKTTCMSGSGPTVFGIFENKNDAENCVAELKSIIPEVFLTKPLNCGTFFE